MTTPRQSGLRFPALLTVAALAAACQQAVTPLPAVPGPTGTPSASSAAGPTPLATPARSAGLPQGSEPVTLDPADFVPTIDNPYWPMSPGARWVYRETDGEGAVFEVDITVTSDTKQILGIAATVVHDVVTEDGELVEDTLDWYAQDSSGNIWYLGEDTKEYEGGKVGSTAGSWEGGVDGAQPGIVVLARPEAGMTYRQEYYAGEAEDAATVLSIDERVDVPFGTFEGVLLTKDYTPLDPATLEYKFYSRGVGPVLVLAIAGGSGREELVTFEPGG